ncbi:MAG: PAS domain-containing protein [Alphaproteobacteria bacterium]
MSPELLRKWFPTVNQSLPLAALADYPDLAALHRVWTEARDAAAAPWPARLDMPDIPRHLLPYVMILDLERAPRPLLRVRLAGTYVCEKYGRELKGRTTDDFFAPQDAQHVVESALRTAKTSAPDLARREYITLNGGLWRYVRLILPMSRNGVEVDSFFKVLDPVSLALLKPDSFSAA